MKKQRKGIDGKRDSLEPDAEFETGKGGFCIKWINPPQEGIGSSFIPHMRTVPICSEVGYGITPSCMEPDSFQSVTGMQKKIYIYIYTHTIFIECTLRVD
jgi:hypothetical protein